MIFLKKGLYLLLISYYVLAVTINVYLNLSMTNTFCIKVNVYNIILIFISVVMAMDETTVKMLYFKEITASLLTLSGNQPQKFKLY